MSRGYGRIPPIDMVGQVTRGCTVLERVLPGRASKWRCRCNTCGLRFQSAGSALRYDTPGPVCPRCRRKAPNQHSYAGDAE